MMNLIGKLDVICLSPHGVPHLYVLNDGDTLESGCAVIDPNGNPAVFGYDFAAVWSKKDIMNMKKIVATDDSNLLMFAKDVFKIPIEFKYLFLEKKKAGILITKVIIDFDDRKLPDIKVAEVDDDKEIMFTAKEVKSILEDYALHYEAHVTQYCDRNEIMRPAVFLAPYKIEKKNEK